MLLGRGRPHGSDDMSAEAIHSFFDKKVSDIRVATSSAAAASFTSTDCVFLDFRSVTHDDVVSAVRSLPNKQCASDPSPTWLFKECSAELVPFLCHLFNTSVCACRSYGPKTSAGGISGKLTGLATWLPPRALYR